MPRVGSRPTLFERYCSDGPLVGLVSSGYIRLIGWVSHHRASGRRILVTFPLALSALGLIGIEYPQLFGNGKDMAHSAFLGEGGLALLFALFALKPLVTALCLGSGGSGGLFTPTLSSGAVLGGFLGMAWSIAWPGSSVGAYAMVGACALIGASMQAPLTALALVLELTHSGFQIMVPMMAATVTLPPSRVMSTATRSTPPGCQVREWCPPKSYSSDPRGYGSSARRSAPRTPTSSPIALQSRWAGTCITQADR